MKMKYLGLTESKLFHFHRKFKNRGGEGGGEQGGSNETPEHPLDPPLAYAISTEILCASTLYFAEISISKGGASSSLTHLRKS